MFWFWCMLSYGSIERQCQLLGDLVRIWGRGAKVWDLFWHKYYSISFCTGLWFINLKGLKKVWDVILRGRRWCHNTSYISTCNSYRQVTSRTSRWPLLEKFSIKYDQEFDNLIEIAKRFSQILANISQASARPGAWKVFEIENQIGRPWRIAHVTNALMKFMHRMYLSSSLSS